MLEGNRAETLAASDELLNATFRDPEGMFYLARQLSYLRDETKALNMLSRAIDNGFFCYPAMVRDPGLILFAAAARLRTCCARHMTCITKPRGPSLIWEVTPS